MRGRGLILVTLCLAALIINLDTTIVNVALPALVRQTGATTTDLQWVVDAHNLVFGALVLPAGSLADRLGRKGMLLAGLAVFGVSSLAGSLATSAGQLTAARAVMGLAAAGVTAVGVLLVAFWLPARPLPPFGQAEAEPAAGAVPQPATGQAADHPTSGQAVAPGSLRSREGEMG